MYGDDRQPGILRQDPDGAPADVADRRFDAAGPISSRCFYLVATGAADAGAADAEPAMECCAFADPLLVSDRQRELVCMTRVHATCPRYLRATAVSEEPGERPRVPPARILRKAFDAALVVALLVMALVAVAAFASPWIGLGGPRATTSTQPAVSASTLPTVTAFATGTAPSAPAASATARPSATARATRTPAPKPTSSWPPGATASRMNLLRPCPGESGCYLYTIRPHETLRTIAAFFGVGLDGILALNPGITNPDFVEAGQTIKIPPPTR